MIPPSRKLTEIGSSSGSEFLRNEKDLVMDNLRAGGGDDSRLKSRAILLALCGEMAFKSIYVRLGA